ncbi:MAG: LAGLIDADG family homing endonuclease [Candidatus ainarchaeum sp.]|nr:LAGLIDADG family homing endonuclease [Candidatus ainarchaeum sp.]
MNSGNPDSKALIKEKAKNLGMQDNRLKFAEGKQREFLERIIQEKFCSVTEFVEFLGFSRRQALNWRGGKILLPKTIFERICQAFPEYKSYEFFIEKELPFNWGVKNAQKMGAEKLSRIQNARKEAIAKGDTTALKESIDWFSKKKFKKHLTPTPRYAKGGQPILFDTTIIGFSGKDLIKKIILPKEISLDLCYVIGAHIGDGSMNRYVYPKQIDYRCSCCGHQINDRKWYETVLIPLYKKLFNLKLVGKKCSDGTYAIQFRSKAIVTFYNKCMGLPLGSKSTIVDIPKIVLDSGLESTLACISGVFDTDFYLGFKNKNKTVHSYPVIDLRTNSPYLAKTISNVLNKIGISNSTGPTKQFDKRNGKISEEYYVTTRGRKNVDKWFELIGSRNPNYFSKYLIWKKFGFCPPNLSYPERKEVLEGRKNPLDFYQR